jgi:REP element-mobilizing transposase RayT
VTNETIQEYVSQQREHCDSFVLASHRHPDPRPYFEFRSFSHCKAEYNCHLVCCPPGHRDVIEPELAQGLLDYVLRIADEKQFVVLSLSILTDHLHLFAALRPDISPADLALAVMNNTSYWLARQTPVNHEVRRVPAYWTSSAYLATAGAVTTNRVRGHIRKLKKARQGFRVKLHGLDEVPERSRRAAGASFEVIRRRVGPGFRREPPPTGVGGLF